MQTIDQIVAELSANLVAELSDIEMRREVLGAEATDRWVALRVASHIRNASDRTRNHIRNAIGGM